MTTHLIRLGSTATVCGIPRTEARGDVSSIRTEVDCTKCRRSPLTPADRPTKPGPFTPRGLGLTR